MPSRAIGARGATRLPVQHHDQGDQPQRKRRHVHRAEMASDVDELGPEAVRCHVDAGQLAELGDDHDHRDSGHVADEHRTGEELGQEGQAVRASRARRAPPPRGRARRRGPRSRCDPVVANPARAAAVISAVVDSGPTDSWLDEPSTAYASESADRRPQPDDRRQPGYFGVCHHLGDEVSRDGHASEDVAAKPASLVAHGPCRSRDPTVHESQHSPVQRRGPGRNQRRFSAA